MSTWIRKLNLKYADAAYAQEVSLVHYVVIDDSDIVDPILFNEAKIDYRLCVQLGFGSNILVQQEATAVSMSTSKAEYRAASMATQECVWLIQLVHELKRDTDYAAEPY
ncbi:hypothetical protein AMTR_s00065p00189090 [Amborella trichopoda]|uniref:Uncharacterized protein n=1 Tax=Amborella trichopoda TaxID=13333 RepID=U5D863_AMBTC|nr:hypothetical protein AMTR_s00065p00189090 [Amborella trichopoda]